MSRLILIVLLLVACSGCATVVTAASERVAGDLRAAVLNHTDPETVRDGAPAWLLMVDAMAGANPDSPRLQAQAAQLYAAYAGGFTIDAPARSKRLAARARTYGHAALCAQRKALCSVMTEPYAEFELGIAGTRAADSSALFAAALGELVWIQAHSDDWNAIANLPRAQFLLERVVTMSPGHERGAPHAFLGVLHSLRSPALGGNPEHGREHFEAALEISGGADLMTKVLYAEHYAKATFDRALHDRLLNEVLSADVRADGFTMTNLLAQRRARELLDAAPEYFFED